MLKKIANGVDFFFNKLLPKKFLVWIVGTVIVLSGNVVPDLYWYICMIYIGGNVIAKFAGMINNNNKSEK